MTECAPRSRAAPVESERDLPERLERFHEVDDGGVGHPIPDPRLADTLPDLDMDALSRRLGRHR